MRDIALTTSLGNWRAFMARKTDPAFQEFAEKIWTRDNYTCQYCGFQAKQYQEIINLNGDYRNNSLSNMVTACVFCTQCFFLEVIGKNDYGGGTLIYFPEIKQTDLNGLCHVLFCAIANATSYHTDAQAIYRSLKLRSKIVEEKLGEGMSNPSLLGQMLIDARINERQQLSHDLLKDLRLLPSRNKFSKQIEAWAQAALEEMEQ